MKKAAFRGLISRTWQLFVHYIHSHFEAEAHFSSSWFGPHDLSPNLKYKHRIDVLV